MKAYHGTDIKNLTCLKPSYGRFGHAIYLTNCPLEAKRFGKYIIQVDLPDNIDILKYEDLIKFEPELNILEEEGLTSLKNHINREVVGIRYRDGTIEIIVYNSIKNGIKHLKK